MSIDMYRRQVSAHQQNIAKLQTDKSRLVLKAAEASKKQQDALQAGARTNQVSTKSMRDREAVRYAGDHNKALVEIARIEHKVAEEHKKLLAAQGKVNQEEARNQKKMDEIRKTQDAAQKKRDDDLKKQQAADKRATQVREHQMIAMGVGLDRHEGLHAHTAHEIAMLKALPERITVLFFASDPGRRSSNKLALDVEARSIQQSITASEHRKAVNFQTRWAVQYMDILQAINELNPTAVHFSGHGTSADALVLQDDQGRAKHIPKEGIVSAIAYSCESVKLVFFNTCFSYNQAQSCIQHVNAAIGMNREIGDEAARVFFSQFYSAIGFGHSIPKAFGQAKAALMMEDLSQADIPELYLKEGLTEDELRLVRVKTPGAMDR
jgi:hypothetical protein